MGGARREASHGNIKGIPIVWQSMTPRSRRGTALSRLDLEVRPEEVDHTALSRLDLEVRPEEVDHGQIARRLAVRDGAAFQNQPILGAVRMRELVEEARLADARLAYDGGHLPVAVRRKLQGTAKLVELGVPANEPGQTASRGGLEPAGT
jgi:hypothetical protein